MKKQTIISTSTASLVALCWPLHVHMEQVLAFSPSTFSPVMRTSSLPLHALSRNNEREMPMSRPFSYSTSPVIKTSNRDLSIRSYADPDSATAQEPATAGSGSTSTSTSSTEEETKNLLLEQDQEALNSWSAKMSELSGSFDEDRLVFPEIASGEVNRVFSNISYKKSEENGNIISKALHTPGSVFGAAALVSGTTIGAGVLALPTATAPAGLLPSSGALCMAWFYMTMSSLLISELAINRMGETGNPSVGLLELYKTSLKKELGWVGSAAYLFLHYAVMVAYISQGGANLGTFLDGVGLESISSIHGLDQVIFAATLGSLVYFARPTVVENVNNTLVIGVIASFLGIIFLGSGSADFSALVAPVNQHPEMVVNALPICFLSMVFHNVVPTVVSQLEGDRKKITQALVAGSIVPLLMFLAWNTIILGNIINIPGALDNGMNPIQLLQNEGIGGERLGQFVSGFSELAITTSFIGFIYGLLDALTDLFGLPLNGPKFEQWKVALYAGVLVPPLVFSLGNPDIFFQALDYGGAFGVSTLFLVLPPIMVWNQRYGDKQSSLTTPPMVPFGKIPLAGLWKVSGTLILEQGADKLGLLDFIKDVWSAQSFL